MGDPASPLADVAHRPWPLPRGPWVLAMRWTDLLFAHWPVPAASLRPHVPAGLELDTFEGSAWLGIVPFRMEGVGLRGLSGRPCGLAFAELNVRTYVRGRDPGAGGAERAGVWFFSLDATSRLAVRAARAWFGLPYFDARMDVSIHADGVSYHCERTHRDAPPAALDVDYAPNGPPYRAAPGSLEHWLTERYALFAGGRDRPLRQGDIHHAPWPLQRAHAEFRRNAMTAAFGLELPAIAPVLHYARRLDVVAWAPRRIGPAAGRGVPRDGA